MDTKEYLKLLNQARALVEAFDIYIDPQDLVHDLIVARLEGDRSAARLTAFVKPYLKELADGLVLIRPNIVTIEVCQ